MPDLTGTTIGRYQITQPLGEGGMATVYRAYDTHLECDVAIKVIRREAFPPDVLDRILKRFEREARVLARLNHPNIVSVVDYGEHDGAPFLVMRFMPGGTLKQRMGGKAMGVVEAARLLLPIANALEYAHQNNVLHRDVKPSNILISEGGVPVLTDFGIARLLETGEGHTLTGTGVGIGTPEYMAPEQGLGDPVDARADVYALGVVFYELITGRRPYEANTPMAVILKHVTDPLPRPRQFNPAISEDVESIICKALEKKPEDRYPNMNAFADELERLVAAHVVEKTTPARPAAPVNQAAQPAARPGTVPRAADAAPQKPQAAARTPATIKPAPATQTEQLTMDSGTVTPDLVANEIPGMSKQPSRKLSRLSWAAGGLVILALAGALVLPGLLNPVEEQAAVATAAVTTAAVTTTAGTATDPALVVVTSQAGEVRAATETQAPETLAGGGSPTATVTNSPTPPGVADAACDQVQFVADVSIPDGTKLKPGEAFNKTWRLRNSGTCTWTSGYALVFADGDALGAAAAVISLPASVPPGATVDLSVPMTAPPAAGSYTSNWKLRNSSGQLFGPGEEGRIFTKIEVVSEDAPAAASNDPLAITAANIDRLKIVWNISSRYGLEGISISPGGEMIAAGTANIALYDADTGNFLRELKTGTATHYPVFSPDGQYIAARLAGWWEVRVWNVADGKLYKTYQTLHWANCFSYSPDGKQWVSCTTEGVYLRTVEDGNIVATLTEEGWSSQTAFSPFGSVFAVGGNEKIVRLLNTRDGSKVWESGVLGEEISALAYSPTGTFLAAAAGDSVVILQASDGSSLSTLKDPRGENVIQLAVTPDGSTVITLTADHYLRFWSLDTLENVFSKQLDAGALLAFLELSRDGRLLVVSMDGALLGFRVQSP